LVVAWAFFQDSHWDLSTSLPRSTNLSACVCTASVMLPTSMAWMSSVPAPAWSRVRTFGQYTSVRVVTSSLMVMFGWSFMYSSYRPACL
jgi:hypothetical protein